MVQFEEHPLELSVSMLETEYFKKVCKDNVTLLKIKWL